MTIMVRTTNVQLEHLLELVLSCFENLANPPSSFYFILANSYLLLLKRSIASDKGYHQFIFAEAMLTIAKMLQQKTEQSWFSNRFTYGYDDGLKWTHFTYVRRTRLWIYSLGPSYTSVCIFFSEKNFWFSNSICLGRQKNRGCHSGKWYIFFYSHKSKMAAGGHLGFLILGLNINNRPKIWCNTSFFTNLGTLITLKLLFTLQGHLEVKSKMAANVRHGNHPFKAFY